MAKSNNWASVEKEWLNCQFLRARFYFLELDFTPKILENRDIFIKYYIHTEKNTKF